MNWNVSTSSSSRLHNPTTAQAASRTYTPASRLCYISATATADARVPVYLALVR